MTPYTREKRLRTRSVAGTHALAETITEILRSTGKGPRLVILTGELGTGKTTLVQGIAATLGASQDDVSSPTFTLLHEYPTTKAPLAHLDLYRLESDRELEGIGLWDLASRSEDSLILVEWGERFPSVVERADAEITISHGENDTERLFLVRWR
ncbi:tRNA threonylcarbamoyladenosine biosynthesis protein TsaE [Bryocella elongata]|uniref:tRNA threonylcarbamoyladenosine biosynthesis protein TsaE n=1 Tax=Bryocella elongata TaxID=863522 RepID=A0A1H5WQ91_9BACT|nr:tRNA (adenosine(37)-N6)-threonylcarbamoyltransferase complex ATPase subunit type 1 TsaE [Bryocella elongata]SEG01662.1 tRNA threonylcarbamoyladenosine biosynthesis protein TsaE [Bryocella elongata]